MKQVKAYIFWIIAGALLLAELVMWFTYAPSYEARNDKGMVTGSKYAEDAKQDIDKQLPALKKLNEQVKLGSPVGVFDAENKDDNLALTTKFLITPSWASTLEPHVKQYDRQLGDIKAFLIDRSRFLHEPIASSAVKLDWYTTYEQQTAQLMQSLVDAKAIILPQAAGPAVAAPDFSKDAAARGIAGLFTRGDVYPEASEHPQLTTRFRIMQMVASAILSSRGELQAHPFSAKGGQADATGLVPAITGVQWREEARSPLAGRPFDFHKGAAQVALSVSVQGAMPAVLAGLAALERGGDLSRPIMVVTGASLGRKPVFAAGERKDVLYEPVTARFEIVVIDFSAKEPATAQAGGPQ